MTMVAGRLCYMSVYAAMFADSNDVPILLMIMFILYIILSTWFHCWIQSSRAQLDIDATITKCMGVAHQWGPPDMSPGLLNVYVYICVCETCITVCRMFLNMYAYTNIYIR